jgi:hypothetical protein
MTLEKREPAEILPHVHPDDQVVAATAMANALQGIVESKSLFKEIGGKKHLLAEAWQTIVAFDNANPVTEWCHPVLDGEETIIAYEAKVNIVKDGNVIASGIMPCGLDEFPCRGQQGYGKHRAAMSSAQTWAGAKAARTKYAWVVTLAGYSGTPADEMPQENGSQGQQQGRQQPTQSSGAMCPVHNIEFFKRGRMKQFAHPIEGTKDWCNQDDVPAANPADEHFCSAHNSPRAKDKQGRWFHQIGDQESWCVEGSGILNAKGETIESSGQGELLDSEGTPVTEGGE